MSKIFKIHTSQNDKLQMSIWKYQQYSSSGKYKLQSKERTIYTSLE